MRMDFTIRLRAFLTLIVLGAVIGLGQEPFGYWVLTLVGLALALYFSKRNNNAKQAFIYGWTIGLGYFLLSFRWIVEPFLIEADRYAWMAPFALLLLSGGIALFWGTAFAASKRFAGSSIWGIVGFLTIAEMARAHVLTGFPWALLGHVWIDTPFAQWAALIGPHGLTLVTLIVAGSLAALLFRKWIFAPLPILIVVLGVVQKNPNTMPDPQQPLIRIVQPNVAQHEKWDPVLKVAHLERLMTFSSSEDAKPDLVVWPETALAQLVEYAQPSIDQISDLMQGTPLVTGIQRRASNEIYHNSLILIGHGGRIDAIYDKRHLVPFGEYFPGGELAAKLGLVGFASSDGAGFSRGETQQTLGIPGVGVARALICYEGIFAEEIATEDSRSDFMILITNDAWFGESAGPQQHLVQARFRAIEQGLPMIRAANTGISAMIDPYGRVLRSVGLDQTGKIDSRLPHALPPTPYVKFGDWSGFFASLILAGFVSLRRNSD